MPQQKSVRRLLTTMTTLLVVTLLVCSGPVAAKKKLNIDALDRKMGQLWQQKRYADVVRVALKLYRQTSDPRLLANVGRCFDLMRQDVKALHYYGRYLRLEKDTARRGPVEKRIAQLKSRLAKTMRRLTIDSLPRGAEIRLNGQPIPKAKTPHTLWVRHGTQRIEVRLKGYRPTRRELTVVAGPPMALQLRLVKRVYLGKIRLHYPLKGLSVFLDGRPVGRTPLAPLQVKPGRYRLEVRTPDGPLIRWVEVRPGMTANVALAPAKKPKPAAMGPMRLTAWITLGVGAAMLVTGLGLHLDGWKINRDANSLVRSQSESNQLTAELYRQYNARFDKSHDRLRWAIGFYSAGTALLVTSVVLFFVKEEERQDDERVSRWKLAPDFSPTHFSLNGRVSF